MLATYTVFPDPREYETCVALANERIRVRNAVTGTTYHPPFGFLSSVAHAPRAWRSVGSMEPDEMLAILSGSDWVHPVLVVYRTTKDERWSYVTMGLAPAWTAGEAA